MRRHPKAALAIAAMLLCLLALPVAAAADALPTVSGETASEVGVTTAKISGDVNPNGTAGDGNTTWRLQYSPVGQEAWTTVNEAAIEPPASEEANPVTVEAILGFSGELAPGETYEYRLQAENGAGPVETAAPYPTFTMDSASAPTLVAEAASALSITSAHLKGAVDPEGGNVNPFGPEVMPIFWELQTSTDGSSWTTAGSGEITGAEAEGTAPITVEADATGLAAGTEYQLRLHAYSTNFGSFNVETDSPGPNPTFTTDPATAPTLTFDPPSAVTSDSSHLAGTVDPEGGNVDSLQGTLPLHWELQVQPEGGSWGTVGSGEITGAEAEGTAPVAVEADATGLVPNTEYKARLLLAYAGLQKSSSEEAFTTDPVAAEISRETLWEQTATSIQLNAKVNPHHAVLTDCHFEYGTDGNLDQTATCESPKIDGTYTAPSNNGDNVVSARISGLVTSTEYSFRLVVTNSAGTEEGDVRSFSTFEGDPSGPCENQSTRSRQHAEHLPDCRAYEMVSPLDKGFEDVVGDGIVTVASRSGDAVGFSSHAQFAGAVGSGSIGQTQYLARRGPEGWSTHSITPMPNPDALQTFFGGTKVQVYSDDLSRALVWGLDLPEASGDSPDRVNMYLEDTATRALQPITVSQQDPLAALDFSSETIWGVSDDARHVALVTNTRLLPEAVAKKPNLYQWDEGELSMAGVLPNGTIPAGGATVSPTRYRGAMSGDGSRLAFRAPATGPASTSQLYLRIDGDRTVWVSQPEGSNKSTPENVVLQGMTRDGSSVFFVTSSPLLDEDTNTGSDLYRYTDSPNPTTEGNLTLISRDGNTAALLGGALISSSDDGQRIYYHTSGATIVLWDHGSDRIIAPAIPRETDLDKDLTVLASGPGWGRATPDGRYMVFVTARAPDNVHGPTGAITNEHAEVYLYSASNDSLTCISCPAKASVSDAAVTPSVTQGNPRITNVGFRPRFVDNSGRIFFSSSEALMPADVNGVADTYQYDPAAGELSLLSTGKGSSPAMFADASISGDDVFVLTRQSMASADTDDLVDLYDVRVNAAPTEPASGGAPVCQGDACQGASTPPPASSPPASAAVAGPGNPTVRCARSNRRVVRGGRIGCIKKHPKHRRHQRANADRRASR